MKVDLQKSGEESKTSKARETDLGGGASGRRGDGGRSLDRGSRLRGDGDGGSRDRGGDGRDGGIVIGINITQPEFLLIALLCR